MKANLLWHTQRANGMLSVLNIAGWTFRIYQGTMPDVSAIASGFTPATYTSQLLLTYAATSASSFARTTDNYQRIFLASIPTAVNATASGIATWFSCTYTTGTYTIVGDISLVSGNAPMKFIDTNIVSGNPYDIYSFAFQFHQ